MECSALTMEGVKEIFH